MIIKCSWPGHLRENLAQNVAQTRLIIDNIVKDTKNIALNTCIIYNVVKNTKDPDNVDLQMVDHLY